MSILKTLMKIMNNDSNHMPGFPLGTTSSSCLVFHLEPLPLRASRRDVSASFATCTEVAYIAMT